MQISPINTSSSQRYNSNVPFVGKKNELEIIKDDEGKEYIKVSKKEYNINKWSWRILIGITIIEIIHLLLTKKADPLDSVLKEFRKTNKK